MVAKSEFPPNCVILPANDITLKEIIVVTFGDIIASAMTEQAPEFPGASVGE